MFSGFLQIYEGQILISPDEECEAICAAHLKTPVLGTQVVKLLFWICICSSGRSI